jgi:hypothetical protein
MAQMNYYRYTRNDGTTYNAIRHRVDLALAGLGFGAASAADPSLPRSVYPRVVYCLHPASGRRRSIVCATPAAFATLTAGGQTLTLPDVGDADGDTWNVTGGRGERVRAPHLIH